VFSRQEWLGQWRIRKGGCSVGEDRLGFCEREGLVRLRDGGYERKREYAVAVLWLRGRAATRGGERPRVEVYRVLFFGF